MRTVWLTLASLAGVALVVTAMLLSVSEPADDGTDPDLVGRAPRAPDDSPPRIDPPMPDRPTDPDADLGGRVVSDEGRPVTGARVTVHPLAGGRWLDERRTKPLAAEVTDGAGRFGVADAPPGSFAFEARAEGYAPGFAVLRGFVPGERSRVHIRLLPETFIEGRTLDSRGEPAPGALVLLTSAQVVRDFQRTAEGLDGLILPARVRVQSDEAGRFRIEGLAPGIYDLVVTAEGMVPVTLYSVHAPAEGVEALLREGLSVSGTITWGGGDPPGGIAVRTRPFNRKGVIDVEEGKARFRIDGLPEGTYDIYARASGFAETKLRIELLRGSETPSVDFRLSPGSTVSGRVTEHYTGRPVSGVLVTFSRDGETETAVTDETGRYQVGLTPGRWLSSVEREGYLAAPASARWSSRLGRMRPGEVEVLDQATELGFRMRARFTITGCVRYRDGGPASAFVHVTEARLRPDVRDAPAESIPKGKGVRTGEDGSFTIEGIVPWGTYTVRATAGPESFVEVRDVAVPEGERTVELPDLYVDYPPAGSGDEPHAPATVRGRVLDERGEPVVGAVVSIGGRPGTTGPDGRFEVPGVPPPSASVRALAAGFAPTVFEGVDLRPGEVVVLRDLVLPREGVKVTGRILDSSAMPIPGASIRIRFEKMEGAFDTVSDDEGIYAIEGPSIPLVQITIQAEAKGYIPGAVKETVGPERVVDVVLRRFASFVGTLSYAGERPESISVSYGSRFANTRKAVAVELSDDGRTFRCEEMALGSHRLTMSAAGYPPKDLGTHTFLEGKTTSLGAFSVGSGGTIEGGVKRKGVYRRATFIVALPELGLKTTTDSRGRFKIDPVPAGKHSITITPKGGGGRKIRGVTVREGKTTRVGFTYP